MTARGAVVWVTGLPASGKSTLARRVVALLRKEGRQATLLDGDAVRSALVPPPGYDEAARAAFYETLGNLALAFAADGLVAVVAATAHRRAFRDRVRERASRFLEVFVDVPPEICAARDPKGLWARALAGNAPDLPGADRIAYEQPPVPEVVARGGRDAAAARAAVAALRATRASSTRSRRVPGGRGTSAPSRSGRGSSPRGRRRRSHRRSRTS